MTTSSASMTKHFAVDNILIVGKILVLSLPVDLK